MSLIKYIVIYPKPVKENVSTITGPHSEPKFKELFYDHCVFSLKTIFPYFVMGFPKQQTINDGGEFLTKVNHKNTFDITLVTNFTSNCRIPGSARKSDLGHSPPSWTLESWALTFNTNNTFSCISNKTGRV